MSIANNYYVYVWNDIHGNPFYVGKGKGERYLSRISRNPAFIVKITIEEGCHPVILEDNLNETEALKKERETIKKYVDEGYELLNIDQNINGQANCDNYIKNIKAMVNKGYQSSASVTSSVSVSYINEVIDDYITSDRNREIIKARILNEEKYTDMEKKFNMSIRQMQNIVYGFCNDCAIGSENIKDKLENKRMTMEEKINDYKTSERNRNIIKDRYINKCTISTIVERYSISYRQVQCIIAKYRKDCEISVI